MRQRSLRRIVAVAAWLGAAAVARAAEPEILLTRHPDKTYEVTGLFTVDASTTVVWDVLSDYDHIPSFVSSMRSSRIRETRGDGTVLVEQKAVGDMFFLTKTMRILLEVRRTPGRIDFTDVAGGDFTRYDGDWEARRTPEGVGVSYHLLARPDFSAPSFLMGRAMKRGARRLLDQVRAEIIRRELAR